MSFHIVVCGSVVPDPLQTLEPVVGGGGPGQQHVLSVQSTSADGKRAVASLRWNDVS